MRNAYAAADHVEYCRLCGAEIVRMTYANGQPYYTDVVIGPNGQKRVITGSGNHLNWKRSHDCVGEAKRVWEESVRNLERYTQELETLRQSVAAYRTLRDAPAPTTPALIETVKSLMSSLSQVEAQLAEKEKSVAQYQPYVAQFRANYDKLASGVSIIPESAVQVGKTVKVVKGRKVPVGTVGRVFWMGEDQYREGQMRVGIATADGSKHYTAATNVEVL
jgi:hypothetical protein